MLFPKRFSISSKGNAFGSGSVGGVKLSWNLDNGIQVGIQHNVLQCRKMTYFYRHTILSLKKKHQRNVIFNIIP